MSNRRRKNIDWQVGEPDGSITWDRVKIAVLMDIRDELQHLNATLDCPDFRAIPRRLAKISSNTANLPKVKK